jgi:ankyrin repeat protein
MGNVPSALQTAALRGDVAGVRVAVQQHPTELNNSDPTVISGSEYYFGVLVYSVGGIQARFTRMHAYRPPLQHGWTALHIAAARGFDVIVRELLAHGADFTIVDKVVNTERALAHAPDLSGQGWVSLSTTA